ncbi:MAG: MerR family DNA-binding protein [Actinomycetota bacterium]|nr:MerR family DNA-binding protein [Actinomycetota bacterium]
MQRTVKQVAAAVGFPSRTVRYYDRIGLVSPSERSQAGYRLYDAHDEGKLSFVRHAKALGLSLQEIRELIVAAESGCGQVVPELNRLLLDKIDEIDQRIGELQTFRQHLVDYAGGKAAGCRCGSPGAFCGCLNDVPLPRTDQGTTMTCNCCSPQDSPTSEPDQRPEDVPRGPGCGCGDACSCATGDPLTAETSGTADERGDLQPQG